jgi:hypothetical protein
LVEPLPYAVFEPLKRHLGGKSCPDSGSLKEDIASPFFFSAQLNGFGKKAFLGEMIKKRFLNGRGFLVEGESGSGRCPG